MSGCCWARLTRHTLWACRAPSRRDAPPLHEMRAILELHKPRARTLRELADQVRLYLVADSNVPYEAEAVRKHLKDDDVRERLRELRNALASVEPFDVPSTERTLRALAERIGVSAAKMIHPLRLALT